MKFLNKKEQVIDLQLTQYGKHLLSQGKFKPIFYAFYDDNVLYDSQYGGFAETQAEIQQRIKSNTPQLEAQYVFRGIETESKRVDKYIRSSKDEHESAELSKIQPMGDHDYGLQYQIGTSELNSNNVPAWSIKFLEGNITSSVTTLSGSHNTIGIPQIVPQAIEYRTTIRGVDIEDQNPENPILYGDSYIDVLKVNDSILLEIEEKNTFFGNENFEVEVYEVQQENVKNKLGGEITTKEHLIPLYFIKQPEIIKNDILLDSDKIFEISSEDPTDEDSKSSFGPSYVEYFLNIETDLEIDKRLLCELSSDKSRGIFGTQMLDCEEHIGNKELLDTDSLYNTDVIENDFEEC